MEDLLSQPNVIKNLNDGNDPLLKKGSAPIKKAKFEVLFRIT
jgi:hypothetical protein